MGKALGSSIGKKLIMAFAGLFLIVFLVVHLGINLLLVLFQSDESFNVAANFMGTNPFIKVMEMILFIGFLVHIIWGLVLQFQNLKARPVGYNVKSQSDTSPFSRYMFHTAVIILIFLVIHIIDFYVKAKFLGGAKEITYDDEVYMHNLAALVIAKFKMPAYVIGYLIAMFALGFHLLHGFQSAFQTIGLNHKSYFPVIKVIGYVYTFVIVAGFSAIPIIVYFTR